MLKAKVADLEAEVASLRNTIQARQSVAPKSHPNSVDDDDEASLKASESDDPWMMVDKQSSDDHDDPSSESPTRFSDVRDSMQLGKSRRESSTANRHSHTHTQANESLLVDLPISSDDSYSFGPGPAKPSKSKTVNAANPRSKTARTYAFALEEPDRLPARSNSIDSLHPMLWLSDEVAALIESSQTEERPTFSSSRAFANITNPFKTTKQAYAERQMLKSASTSTMSPPAQGSSNRQPLKSAFEQYHRQHINRRSEYEREQQIIHRRGRCERPAKDLRLAQSDRCEWSTEERRCGSWQSTTIGVLGCLLVFRTTTTTHESRRL